MLQHASETAAVECVCTTAYASVLTSKRPCGRCASRRNEASPTGPDRGPGRASGFSQPLVSRRCRSDGAPKAFRRALLGSVDELSGSGCRLGCFVIDSYAFPKKKTAHRFLYKSRWILNSDEGLRSSCAHFPSSPMRICTRRAFERQALRRKS